MTSTLTAADVIALLGLKPHPEAGHYRETFRDQSLKATDRPASTAIYFLLTQGQRSRWHRLDAVELWHWYAGAPLTLLWHGAQGPAQLRLGSNLAAGERPQAVVPARYWQAAESLGAWTLVGCTVAPGFSWSGFEVLAPGASPPWGAA
jgi:hypothetical protein